MRDAHRPCSHRNTLARQLIPLGMEIRREGSPGTPPPHSPCCTWLGSAIAAPATRCGGAASHAPAHDSRQQRFSTAGCMQGGPGGAQPKTLMAPKRTGGWGCQAPAMLDNLPNIDASTKRKGRKDERRRSPVVPAPPGTRRRLHPKVKECRLPLQALGSVPCFPNITEHLESKKLRLHSAQVYPRPTNKTRGWGKGWW